MILRNFAVDLQTFWVSPQAGPVPEVAKSRVVMVALAVVVDKHRLLLVPRGLSLASQRVLFC